jgi:hypothetical protein
MRLGSSFRLNAILEVETSKEVCLHRNRSVHGSSAVEEDSAGRLQLFFDGRGWVNTLREREQEVG